MEILLDYRVIYTTKTWRLMIVAWLKYSHANTANTTDTGWLTIVAWLKYSHANTAGTANTMEPIIAGCANVERLHYPLAVVFSGDVGGAVLGFVENAAEVLADYAEGQELDSAEEQDDDDERGESAHGVAPNYGFH
jgi:hypothetical protein